MLKVIVVLAGCRIDHQGLVGTLQLLNAKPSWDESMIVVSVILLSAFELLVDVKSVGLFILLLVCHSSYWSAVALARGCTRSIQQHVHEMELAMLRGENASTILGLYTRFQQKLLIAYKMYNRVVVPIVLLDIAIFSFWLAAFIRLHSTRSRAEVMSHPNKARLIWYVTFQFLRDVLFVSWVIMPSVRTANVHKRFEMAILGKSKRLMNEENGLELLAALGVGQNHAGFKISSTVVTWDFLLKSVSYGSILITIVEKVLDIDVDINERIAEMFPLLISSLPA